MFSLCGRIFCSLRTPSIDEGDAATRACLLGVAASTFVDLDLFTGPPSWKCAWADALDDMPPISLLPCSSECPVNRFWRWCSPLDYDLRLVVATERRTRCSARPTISVRQTSRARSLVSQARFLAEEGWC